jgi:hypothetical protein
MTNSYRASAAPGRSAGGLGGAPGGAASYVTGRARLPCRARWERYSHLKGARWCPGASRRSTFPRAGRARDWQTSGASRRENAKLWLFESADQKLDASTQIQRVERNKRRVSDAHCAALRGRAEDRWRNALRLLRPTRCAVIPGCASWRRPGIHSPCVRGWMLNANTVVMDSGLARRARPGMTSCGLNKTKSPSSRPGFPLIEFCCAIRRRA